MVQRRSLFISALLCLASFSAAAAPVNVTTWRYDNGRTGQNTNETQLTLGNVNSASFGRLFNYAVDGYVYAQPLYLSTPTRNLVFIATQRDIVYAFDADKNQQVWKANLLDAAHGVKGKAVPVTSAQAGTNDIVPEIGITGTPVIDPVSGTLYVVAKSYETGDFFNRLHALDVNTGAEKPGSPIVITASVPGTGAGAVNGVVTFNQLWELNRSGLLLYNNTVYIAFAAHGDNGPYHGWLLAYDGTTLKQTGAFNTSSNGRGNGIWGSGAGLAMDIVNGLPRLFFATGNFIGNGNPNPSRPYTSSQNYSNAIVRMDISNGALKVSDSWTPFDQAQLSASDSDQTSGGILILPDQPGAHTHELIQVGKNGRIEVLDRNDLGGFNTSFNDVVQEVSGQVHGLWSTPAYWNGNVYFWGNDDYLKQFKLANGLLGTKPVKTGTVHSFYPGATAVVSSNGTADGIVWAIRSDRYNSNGREVLYAFDGNDISKLLYSSAEKGARDVAGGAVKFTVPIVANGKVYIGALGEVNVFGLLAGTAPAVPAPTFSPAEGVYSTAQSVRISESQSGATIYYTTDGSTPTKSSTTYTGPINVASTTTVKAIGVASGFRDSSVASAAYTIGTAPSIDFSHGFASVAGLTLNGSAINLDDSRLQLTVGAPYEAGSAFFNTPVSVEKFSTDFTFQLSGAAPIADGITFTLQSNSAKALGAVGGALGYAGDKSTGVTGITNSVAVKFDVYNNVGEGANSIGVYLNGATPTKPATSLAGTGINLASGNTLTAHLSYDGTNLSIGIKDPVTGGSYSGKVAVNIPTALHATTGYVGFTGGTGGLSASQKILTWTYTPQSSPTQPPAGDTLVFQTDSLPFVSSGPSFHPFNWTGFPDGVGGVFECDKVGQTLSFEVNVAKTGTYDVHVTTQNFKTHGQFQLAVDGANVSKVKDEYSATQVLGDFDLGNVVLSAGKHTFKFTLMGRNAAGTSKTLAFDTLVLDPQ